MTSEECLRSSEECLILQGLVMRGEGAKGEDDSFLKVSFFDDH